MMPNERGRRGAALRSAALVVVGIALVVLAARAWGPLASSSPSPASGVGGSLAAASGSIGQVGIATPGASGSAAPVVPSGGADPSSKASPSAAVSGSASPSSSPSGSPFTPSATPIPAGVLQSTLDRVRLKLSIPGVSVAILWDDGRIWTGASGLRNVAAKEPMTTGTAFALASVSKTLTAAVVMELVQEGKLGLDQPVAPLLPAFRLDKRITVRMLLDHTSGLRDYFLGRGIDAALQSRPNATWTAQQAWSYVPKPNATPGHVWIYSNSNYLLLGQLVTAVTGHPLAQEIRTRLLGPLGLSSAWYQTAEAPRAMGTVAYRMSPKKGGGWLTRPVAPLSGVMPFRSVITAAGGAGSIAATALDAALWMRAWADGQLLSPTMQAAVLADVARTVKLHAAIPYGLGIERTTLNGYTALGHSGRYLGIRNVVRYLPDAGVTIAVLTNQSAIDPTRIATALLNVALAPPTAGSAPIASPGSTSAPASPGASSGPSVGPSASPSPS